MVQGVMAAGAFVGAWFIPAGQQVSASTTAALFGLGGTTVVLRVRLHDIVISSASLALLLAAILGNPMLASSSGRVPSSLSRCCLG
jgi:hypothetical protein